MADSSFFIAATSAQFKDSSLSGTQDNAELRWQDPD
jgi:hypothetical protein